MLNTEKEGKILDANATHHSDGSELVPAEVQANTSLADSELVDNPLKPGYTVDDEGIMNNYAVEPATSLAEYPSPEQQKRYIFQGIAAILFLSLILLIVFNIS